MEGSIDAGHRDSLWDKYSQPGAPGILVAKCGSLCARAYALLLERQDILRDQTFALDRGCLRPTDLSLLHLTLEDLPPHWHGRLTVGSDGATAIDGRDDMP